MSDAGEELLGRALDRTLLRRILGYVRPYRRTLATALVLLPIASAFELLQPYLLKQAIDDHIAVGRLAGLDRLGLIYLAALVGQYGAGLLHLYLTQTVGQRAMNDLRLATYRHVLSLRASFFDRTPVGRLMTRMTNDIESLNEMFASGLVSLLGDLLKLGFILIVIFGIDFRLAAFSMASAPVLLAIALYFRRLVRDAFRAIRTRLARLNGFLQEHISGMKVVQAFAREGAVAERFDVVNRDYRAANARAIGADAALYALVEAVGSIAMAGLLWHGGARIAGGMLTFGVLVAFIEYLTKFFAPIRDLSSKYTVMQQAMAAAERVFGLLDSDDVEARPRPPTAGTAAPDAARAARAGTPIIEFDRVTFAYRQDTPVLHDVSFRVERGETVAVVGATGSGKSTLVKLLGKLYQPGAGAIRVDGLDLRDLPTATLRRRLVVVNQDVFLFAGTLGDNIGLRDPAVDPARMADAARRVGADRVIAVRAEGLAAPVVERGANFSVGERQIVAFARALARDPEILVLDEATASVDPESERWIERGIAELMRGRTSIVIAHRLSTIQRADRILVMHKGRIAEQGTHTDLLAHDGIYAKLYRLQMAHGPTNVAGASA